MAPSSNETLLEGFFLRGRRFVRVGIRTDQTGFLETFQVFMSIFGKNCVTLNISVKFCFCFRKFLRAGKRRALD